MCLFFEQFLEDWLWGKYFCQMWKGIKCCKYTFLYKVDYFVCLKKWSAVYTPNSVLLQLQKNPFVRLVFSVSTQWFCGDWGANSLENRILFFPSLLYLVLYLRWLIYNLCTYCYVFYSVNCGLRNADCGLWDCDQIYKSGSCIADFMEEFCCLLSFLEEQIRKLKYDLCAIFMHNNYGCFTTFYPLELCIWKLFHCNRKLDR